MKFDDTLEADGASSGRGEPRVPTTSQAGSATPKARARGVETQARKAQVLAGLFDEPAPAVMVGRFSIVRKLGAGGMGVVYMAYDEELDRRVAVKLLRSTDTDTVGRARMKREAQAMARLSHPNVVTVYEVDSHEGQLFVAMEYVEGDDLRGWLDAGARPWPEVVAVFCQAGRGLAAAHAAGLVHRDFKPDNVLVGRDGRARVADFGLAHVFEALHEEEPETVSSGEFAETLTRTGAIMGTPAYMAPEQYAGERGDARSDQFAFCVALWEGLFGERPFRGRTLAQLSAAISEGRIATPEGARAGAVPEWLTAAVRRGLAAEPDARWPSMEVLLEVLTDDPRARRTRRLRWALSTLVVGAVLAGTSWVAGRELARNQRQAYWSALTEDLLGMERERGFRQVSDDAARARDATRMSVYRSYRSQRGVVSHEDPTVAAILLREVESDMRGTDEWISAANETLAQPISAAVLRGHRAVVTALVFDLEAGLLYSADGAGEVWRWDLSTAKGRRLHVHAGEVTSLALSPDAGVLISGSRDGELRAWTPEAGGTTLARYPEGITTVVFSEGGERVAVGARDGKVRMYAGQGRLDLEWELGVGSVVYALAFDGAGERLLTGSKDGRGRVWSLADGELLATLEGHSLGVFYAAFIDADELVTASDDNQVSYWKLAGDGEPPTRRLVVKHRRAVSAFALRGRELLSGSVSGEVVLTKLDPERGREGFASTLVSKHGDDVRFVAFHGRESLVSVGFDAIAQAQPVDLRAPATVMRGHRSAILSAAHSGRWLATGAWDGAVRVWDLDQPGADRVLDGHAAKIFDLAVDRAGERVATAAHDGTVRVWRIRDGALVHEFEGIDRIVNAVAFSPDGRSLASAGKLGVTLWSLEDGSVRELGGHNQAWVVDFDARGERLVSVGSDRLVRIWDLATGESRVLSGHEGRVFEAAFRPGGAELATASDDGSVRVWGADSGEVIARLPKYDPTVLAMLAWSPDGAVLAASAQDGGAWLWGSADLLWGAEQPTPTLLREHGARVRALAFDARSQRLATGSDDGVVRVWALDSGDLVQRLSGHAEPVSALTFADSGRALVSGSWDSTVRFWDLDTGRALILTGHGGEVNDVVVSVSSQMLVSASADGSARTWDLSRMERSPEALTQALGAATRACLPAEQRVRELGEDEQSARLAQYRCERE